jgi:hypothetical protein
MSRQSVRLAASASGSYLAFEDLLKQDGSSNSVIAEFFVLGSLAMPSEMGNAKRGNSSMVSAADTFNLLALPNDLLGNLFDTEDKSLLVVSVEQTVDNGSVTITPIVYNDYAGAAWTGTASKAVGDLVAPTVANGYAYECTTSGTTGGTEPTWGTTPGGTTSDNTVTWTCRLKGAIVGILVPKVFTQPISTGFRRGSGTGNFLLPFQTWDVMGARRLALHVSAFTGTSNTAKAYAWMV